ncbi:kinase-like domain-containing protein [Entophlyctis helioformis]|nr:kinase-like domain-containing protein [Entophlyctis helioformis]
MADVTPITERYRFRREIGRGAYGTVCAAKDNATGRDVAIKKVGARNFDEVILTKRALREVKLLRHLNGHDNVALFIDVDINDPTIKFTELYVVEGLMEADLNQIIKSGQQLTKQHFQYFLYQMLRGLKWMHSANIIHRDLKPGNLLVNSDCELRICDFGLARGISDVNAHLVNTEYVATRYYRAPEVVLSPKHYTKAIDMWSVGCIFGEMLTGRVLFKGSDYIDQLQKIFEILGTPQDPALTQLCSARVLKYLRTWPKRPKAALDKVFPRADAEGLDLLDKLLAFDATLRITAEQSLAHPFLAVYHYPDDEPSHPKLFDFGFEEAKTIEDIKKLIVEEVIDFRETQKRAAAAHAANDTLDSPRRTQMSKAPEIDEKKVQDVPRYEDEIAPNGPNSLEEELQIRNLKLDE